MTTDAEVGQHRHRPAGAAPGSGPGGSAAEEGLRGLLVVALVGFQAAAWLGPDSVSKPVTQPAVAAAVLAGGLLALSAVGVTGALLDRLASGTLDPVRFLGGRVLLLGAHLLPLCVAVTFLNRIDPDGLAPRDMAANVGHTLTFTLNWWSDQRPDAVRPELGHLWYFSVQQQLYVVLPLVLLLLGSRRWLVAVVALAGVVAAVWWRQELLTDRGWVQAAWQTPARADGVLLGVLVAAVVPLLGRLLSRGSGRPTGWRVVQLLSVLTLAAVGGALAGLTTLDALVPAAVAVSVAAALAGAALGKAEPLGPLRLLGSLPMRGLGRCALAGYVWHLPVFVAVAAHTDGWTVAGRAALAVAVLVAVVLAMVVVVERPTREFLLSRTAGPGGPFREETA